MIIIWHGSIASIPSGFILCDGNNGTPDLRDKFIVGAKEDDGGVAKTNIYGALSQSGGNVLHEHTGTTTGHAHTDGGQVDVPGGTPDVAAWDASQSSSSETDVFTTDALADDAALPPYYALAYIMKT